MTTPQFFDSDPFSFDRFLRRQKTLERESRPDYMVFSTPGKQPSGLADDIMSLVQMMSMQQASPRAATPKIYEMGNRLIQVDEAGPKEIYSAPTPQKDVMGDFMLKAAQQKVLNLQKAAFDPDAARQFRLQGTTPEAELEKAMNELTSIVGQRQPAVSTNAPAPFAFDPFQAAMRVSETNAPAAVAPKKSRFKVIELK